MFSTAKTVVSSLPTTTSTLVSSQPFINPAAQHTSLVVPPAVQETVPKVGESKPIKKAPKSSKCDKAKPNFGPQTTASAGPVLDIPGSGDDIQEPVFQPLHASSTVTADMGLQSTSPEQTTGQEYKATGSSSLFTKTTKHTGQESHSTGPFEPAPYPPATAASSVSFAGPGYGVSDTDHRDLPQQDISDAELSRDEDSAVEEGEVSSDVIDIQDQTEDMTYRETVRSVRSFMGWNHIPVYESDLSEPDKSNNPLKNPKKPARISVAMPPDDWLC